ncbi:transcriptional antiterminator [Enterovibrio norvegicus FF-162]|uniref:Transcriptional antiterminator n=1 Tax=Enterovibrio norvegicus FF-454 TaxID=1185651 RepID=A0A1E5C5W0_9GAMM|nr:Rho-binding antiterminator [Enterovibrio norvegicus]OEE60829.1 transcriptional antiterminator [Enterovibrio norvegicus FF-454]OEE74556.1 transcriptional antiterminator [Enterovibrio norvegicus FF-162]
MALIKCEEYDYVEIVCLFHYPIKLVLKSGEVVEGIAQDTARNGDKQECIAMNVNSKTVLVLLDQVLTLDVLIDNPHFKHITFSQ